MAQRPKKDTEKESRREETMSDASEETGATASPTEHPVPTEHAVAEYVITVDVTSGTWLKIEKLDDKTGKRTELSQQEYAAAFAVASYSAPYFAAQAASFHDPLQNPAVQAYLGYFKNIADYLQATLAPR